ncbi:MAG TPA: iron-containing alcohol dehydrogenase [Solirubrobacteraceae bacterium]|nr:iron-containing alcohol dehydrogenase [Solirubrobacteraceae bacterium]
MAIPRLLHVGTGCLGEVGALLRAHEFDVTRVLVGSGPGPSRILATGVVQGMRACGIQVVRRSDLCGRLDQAAAAAATIIEEGVTVAVAVGGGRAIDPLKLAAARTGVDFVSVPTTISNDGISSPVASLVDRDGARTSRAARMPCGTVVDMEAIGSAPPATLRAGAGDLISNLIACLDWRLADRQGLDHYDAYSAMIAESAARPILEIADLGSPAAREVLAQGLLMSGLAMAAAGTSRPCSGPEHLVSHALDAQLGPRAALHGEQVALGCLVASAAHESPLLETLRRVFARLGLPTRAEDLGLMPAEVAAAVRAAPGMRPGRWTILSARSDDADELVARALADATPPADHAAPSWRASGVDAMRESSQSMTRSVA